MKITKFEQSGFIIESDGGFKLAFDIGAYTTIEKLKGISCDVVLASHIHGDHFNIDRIKALTPKRVFLNAECIETIGEESFKFEVIPTETGNTLKIGEFLNVEFFNVDHGPNISAPLKENFGFLITVDDKAVYFAGDMYNPSGIDVTNLEVDYALLPVGGHYTFGPQEAFNFAKQFKKIEQIIPMHYEKNDFVYPERYQEFVGLAKDSFKIWN